MTSCGLAIAQSAVAVALTVVALTDVYEKVADVALTAGYEKLAAADTSVLIAGPATFAARAI